MGLINGHLLIQLLFHWFNPLNIMQRLMITQLLSDGNLKSHLEAIALNAK